MKKHSGPEHGGISIELVAFGFLLVFAAVVMAFQVGMIKLP